MKVQGKAILESGFGATFADGVAESLVGRTFNDRTVISAERILPTMIVAIVELEVPQGFAYPFTDYDHHHRRGCDENCRNASCECKCHHVDGYNRQYKGDVYDQATESSDLPTG